MTSTVENSDPGIAQLVRCLNTSQQREFLRSLHSHRFTDLDLGRVLHDLADPHPKYVLFKYEQPLYNADLGYDSLNVKLSLGRMHHITSGGVPWGVVFEVPLCTTECDTVYFKALRDPTVRRWRGTKEMYRSKLLSVWCDQLGSALLAIKVAQ